MADYLLAVCLQTCLGQRWTHDDYSDFTVVVEDMEFKCHRFILASCSTFFSLLLRNDMKENMEKKVVLKNIKKETFSVILNSIYKGEDGLTLDNILDVWHSTHMLDIKYLFKRCEHFISKKLQLINYITFFYHATFMNSITVLSAINTFFLQNFEHFKSTQTFLEFSVDEVHKLIEDYNLNVRSENVVIEAILEWVDYNPKHDTERKKIEIQSSQMITSHFQNEEENVSLVDDKGTTTEHMKNTRSISEVSVDKVKKERHDKFLYLFKSARLCLASEKYLENLLMNPLITCDVNAMDLVKKALLYHWKPQNYLNTFINYRKCHEMCNVVAFLKRGTIFLYLLNEKCVLNASSTQDSYSGIAANKEELVLRTVRYEENANSRRRAQYVCYDIYDITKKKTRQIFQFVSGGSGIFLCVKNDIIIISSNSHQTIECHHRNNEGHGMMTIKTDWTPCSAFVHQDHIFVFLKTNNGTLIMYYTLEHLKPIGEKEIPGPSEDIAHFQNEYTTFMLQRNGTLWLIESNEKTIFALKTVTKLWDFDWNLRGAFCYLHQLFLFGEYKSRAPAEQINTSSLPGVFERIIVVINKYDTNAVPVIIPRKSLKYYF